MLVSVWVVSASAELPPCSFWIVLTTSLLVEGVRRADVAIPADCGAAYFAFPVVILRGVHDSQCARRRAICTVCSAV